MAEELDVLLRILALEGRQAVRATSHMQVGIRPDALVVCPIAMAGEDASVHIAAMGGLGKAPEILCVPNPLVRDDQYNLFREFGKRIARYFEQCRTGGVYPQIWVSSHAAEGLLDAVAERLCTARGAPDLTYYGQLLSYCTERHAVAGQQTLHVATDVLSRHFATGQQEGEDEHLGALLTWIRPPKGTDVLVAVAVAEKTPMGCKTDPEFDRRLEPRIKAYDEARKAGASAVSLRQRAESLKREMETVVNPIYNATQRAIRILQSSQLPSLPDLPQVEARERDEFQSFMISRDAGYGVLPWDTPKLACFKFSEREDAEQNLAAAVSFVDKIAQARARLAGNILSGVVENAQTRRLGVRRFEYTFDVVSDQRVLHVRRGDELSMVADPRLQIVVVEVQRTGPRTRVLAKITNGMRAVGNPAAGQMVEFGGSRPDWFRIIRQRKQLKERLQITPWTYSSGPPPPPRPKTAKQPPDLLASVEALR
jgi:hypothetical protein